MSRPGLGAIRAGSASDAATGHLGAARVRGGARLAYRGDVERNLPRLSLQELCADLSEAPPPTSDDVTILLDGRRLDTKEKVLAWIEELDADRAAGRSVLDTLP